MRLIIFLLLLYKFSFSRVNGFVCEGEGFFGDPYDCAKFYRCVNGNPFEFFCGAGTHFNPSHNGCDWPYNTGCKPQIKPEYGHRPYQRPNQNYNQQQHNSNNQRLPDNWNQREDPPKRDNYGQPDYDQDYDYGQIDSRILKNPNQQYGHSRNPDQQYGRSKNQDQQYGHSKNPDQQYGRSKNQDQQYGHSRNQHHHDHHHEHHPQESVRKDTDKRLDYPYPETRSQEYDRSQGSNRQIPYNQGYDQRRREDSQRKITNNNKHHENKSRHELSNQNRKGFTKENLGYDDYDDHTQAYQYQSKGKHTPSSLHHSQGKHTSQSPYRSNDSKKSHNHDWKSWVKTTQIPLATYVPDYYYDNYDDDEYLKMIPQEIKKVNDRVTTENWYQQFDKIDVWNQFDDRTTVKPKINTKDTKDTKDPKDSRKTHPHHDNNRKTHFQTHTTKRSPYLSRTSPKPLSTTEDIQIEWLTFNPIEPHPEQYDNNEYDNKGLDFNHDRLNSHPLAINQMMSYFNCTDAGENCTKCQELNWIKFPELKINSAEYRSYQYNSKVVSQQCYKKCKATSCIAFVYSVKSGMCHIYDHFSSDEMANDKEWTLVMLNAKSVVINEEWFYTKHATIEGKNAVSFHSDNFQYCLSECSKFDQCLAASYDILAQICKLFDHKDVAKKVSLHSNSLVFQRLTIFEDNKNKWRFADIGNKRFNTTTEPLSWMPVEHEEECFTECFNNPQCYIVSLWKMRDSPAIECIMYQYESSPKWIDDDSLNSYVMNAPKNHSKFIEYPGYSFVGNPIDNEKVESLEECHDLIEKCIFCRKFTFDSKTKECHLFSDSAFLSPSKDTESSGTLSIPHEWEYMAFKRLPWVMFVTDLTPYLMKGEVNGHQCIKHCLNQRSCVVASLVYDVTEGSMYCYLFKESDLDNVNITEYENIDTFIKLHYREQFPGENRDPKADCSDGEPLQDAIDDLNYIEDLHKQNLTKDSHYNFGQNSDYEQFPMSSHGHDPYIHRDPLEDYHRQQIMQRKRRDDSYRRVNSQRDNNGRDDSYRRVNSQKDYNGRDDSYRRVNNQRDNNDRDNDRDDSYGRVNNEIGNSQRGNNGRDDDNKRYNNWKNDTDDLSEAMEFVKDVQLKSRKLKEIENVDTLSKDIRKEAKKKRFESMDKILGYKNDKKCNDSKNANPYSINEIHDNNNECIKNKSNICGRISGNYLHLDLHQMNNLCNNVSVGNHCEVICKAGYKPSQEMIICEQSDHNEQQWSMHDITCNPDDGLCEELTNNTMRIKGSTRINGKQKNKKKLHYMLTYDKELKIPKFSLYFHTPENSMEIVEPETTFFNHPCPKLKGHQLSHRDYQSAEHFNPMPLLPQSSFMYSPESARVENYYINSAPMDAFTSRSAWKILDKNLKDLLIMKPAAVIAGVCPPKHGASKGKNITIPIPECFWRIICTITDTGEVTAAVFYTENSHPITMRDKRSRIEQVKQYRGQDFLAKIIGPRTMRNAWSDMYQYFRGNSDRQLFFTRCANAKTIHSRDAIKLWDKIKNNNSWPINHKFGVEKSDLHNNEEDFKSKNLIRPNRRVNHDNLTVDDMAIHVEDMSKHCGKRIIGYVISTSNATFTIDNGKLLTHVILAHLNIDEFGNINKNDTINKVTYGKLYQLLSVQNKLLEHNNHHLKTMFSIGGWNNSNHLSSVMSSQHLRNNLISNILSVIDYWSLNGVEIDWRYPVIGENGKESDKENYSQFLREIRHAFNMYERIRSREEPLIVSITVAPGFWIIKRSYDLPSIIDFVDWINVMTQDYYVPGVVHTSPLAPLYYAKPNVQRGKEKEYENDLLKMNVHESLSHYACEINQTDKIVLSVALYGRYWNNVGEHLFHEKGHDHDIWRKANPNGGFTSYRDINSMMQRNKDFIEKYDNKSKSSYLWSESRRMLLSYENGKSINDKIKYIADHNLGGISLWAVDFDTPDHDIQIDAAKLSQQRCANGNNTKYKCKAEAEAEVEKPVKRWYTREDGHDSLKCGPSAPKINGTFAICNPSSGDAYCCSQWGFCGSGPLMCNCQKCVNFKKTPHFKW